MRLEAGDPLPAFSLPFVAGRRCEHSSWPGKLLLVVFTCNSCPVVKAYAARLAALVAEFSQPAGLPDPRATTYEGPMATLAIHSNPEGEGERFGEVAAALGSGAANHLCAHDANQEVARAFGATTTPEFFLFTRQATLAYRGAMDDNLDAPKAKRAYLREAVEALLAGHAPPISESEPRGCALRWRDSPPA